MAINQTNILQCWKKLNLFSVGKNKGKWLINVLGGKPVVVEFFDTQRKQLAHSKDTPKKMHRIQNDTCLYRYIGVKVTC